MHEMLTIMTPVDTISSGSLNSMADTSLPERRRRRHRRGGHGATIGFVATLALALLLSGLFAYWLLIN